MKEHARQFFRMPPGDGHRLPALRVALGIAVPLVALVLAGRLDLTVYAMFGALTGVYGRVEPHWLRLRHQTEAGAIMTLCVLLGVAANRAGAGVWPVAFLTVVLAGVLSVVSDVLRLRPMGPFFPLFAFTGSAAVPFSRAPWEAGAAAAGSVAVVLVLGFAGRAWARRRTPERGLVEPPRPGLRRMVRHGGRYLAATGFSGLVATSAGLGHSYWAMVAACAPIAAADASSALVRAVHRAVGTLGGVVLTGALLSVHWSPLQLAVGLAALQFVGEVYVVRHYSVALVFMTPVALLLGQFVSAVPGEVLTRDRAVETLVGAAVAFGVILATTVEQRRAERLRPDDAATPGLGDRRRPVLHAELRVDVHEVRLHRGLGDEERLRKRAWPCQPERGPG
ncbi:hypothetical protein ACVWWH_003515 [Sinomonas sp. RB5]